MGLIELWQRSVDFEGAYLHGFIVTLPGSQYLSLLPRLYAITITLYVFVNFDDLEADGRREWPEAAASRQTGRWRTIHWMRVAAGLERTFWSEKADGPPQAPTLGATPTWAKRRLASA